MPLDTRLDVAVSRYMRDEIDAEEMERILGELIAASRDREIGPTSITGRPQPVMPDPMKVGY